MEKPIAKKKMTLDELKAKLAAMGYDRQHGRAGTSLEDEAAELRRLYNNLKSRESRARKRQLEKQLDADLHDTECNPLQDAGIYPVDERRYKACFNIFEDTSLIDMAYIKRMTGLSDTQISLLEKHTKLKANKLL